MMGQGGTRDQSLRDRTPGLSEGGGDSRSAHIQRDIRSRLDQSQKLWRRCRVLARRSRSAGLVYCPLNGRVGSASEGIEPTPGFHRVHGVSWACITGPSEWRLSALHIHGLDLCDYGILQPTWWWCLDSDLHRAGGDISHGPPDGQLFSWEPRSQE